MLTGEPVWWVERLTVVGLIRTPNEGVSAWPRSGKRVGLVPGAGTHPTPDTIWTRQAEAL